LVQNPFKVTRQDCISQHLAKKGDKRATADMWNDGEKGGDRLWMVGRNNRSSYTLKSKGRGAKEVSSNTSGKAQ